MNRNIAPAEDLFVITRREAPARLPLVEDFLEVVTRAQTPAPAARTRRVKKHRRAGVPIPER
jgi:hypothetical protein